MEFEKLDETILNKITTVDNFEKGAYNIRKNGKGLFRKTTPNINITTKKDTDGIDIHVKENTDNEIVHIPVLVTLAGVNDMVYNDFHIGENAKVTIVAGCSIHNCGEAKTQHNGIHRFFLAKNASVKYVENHYGEGTGTGEKILNPVTEVYLEEGSMLEMETSQLEGVDSTIRETRGIVKENASFIVKEKIMTHDDQYAKTIFDIELNGDNSSTKVTSRAVAKDNSKQIFASKIHGNSKCFAHTECDAILKDNAKVIAVPEIEANDADANLIHEATIGKIASAELIKLMTLGLSEKESEEKIIQGFLSKC